MEIDSCCGGRGKGGLWLLPVAFAAALATVAQCCHCVALIVACNSQLIQFETQIFVIPLAIVVCPAGPTKAHN